MSTEFTLDSSKWERYSSDIPDLGQVTVRPARYKEVLEALKAANNADDAQKGIAFVRSLLKSVLETPALSAIDISDINLLDAVVPLLAKAIMVEKEYEETNGELPATLRLLEARQLRFNREVEPLAQSVSSVIKGLAYAGQLVNKFTKQLAEINKDVRDFSQKMIAAFQPIIEETEAWYTREMAETLARYRWWYVPTMSRELIKNVDDLVRQGKGRSINAYICRHYRENRCKPLRDMVDGWYDLSYFQKRRPIFEAALSAHRQGKYILSVPTLVPHIEGIAQEFLLDLGLKKAVNWTVLAKVLGTSQTKARIIVADSFGDALLEVFFAHFERTDQYSSKLINRHAILHGRHMTYASQANSLRSFLALESLHYFLNVVLSQLSPAQLKAEYDREMQTYQSQPQSQKRQSTRKSTVNP